MSNLESKATKITLVIRKNTHLKESDINSFCEEFLSRYAWIEHLNDISTETLQVEGVHYHIVGTLKNRTRLGTILSRVVKHFNFDNPFGIEIATANSIEGCYQYLIHKNDKDKTPHDISECHTNIPAEEFQTLMELSFTDNTINQNRIDILINDNVNYHPATAYKPAYISINYREIARGIGATRCNVVSWSLNNTIKQRVYELCRQYDIPIPDKY